jgi:hypothetical protein
MNCDVLSWRNQESLKITTNNLLNGILTNELIDHFRNNRPTYFVSDDSTWLDNAIKKVHGISIKDSFQYFGEKIRKNVNYLRAYHGCKPIDIKPYFTSGLVPLKVDKFVQSTIELFREYNLTEPVLLEAMHEISTEFRENLTWFVLDDRSFLDGAGHYLIYGGEYLQSVAGIIQRKKGIPIHLHLEKTGIPTVFVCDIPIKKLSIDDLWELSGAILENYFEIIFDGRKNNHGLNYGFSINTILSPEYLIDHYHPTEIENPFYNRMIYRPEKTNCFYCKKIE